MKYSLTLYHSLVAEYVGLVSLFRDFHENHRIDRVEETQDDMFHCLALGFHNINLAIIDLPFYDETTRFTEPIAGRLLSPSAWCISIHDSGTCKIHLLSPLTSFIPIWVGIGYIRKLFPPPFPSSSSWPVSLPLPPGRFGLLSGQLLHGLRTLRRNIMSGPANAVNAVNPHQSDMLNPMPVGSLGTLTNLGAPVFVFLSPQAHVPWQVLTTGFINTLVHCRVRCTRDPRRQ